MTTTALPPTSLRTRPVLPGPVPARAVTVELPAGSAAAAAARATVWSACRAGGVADAVTRVAVVVGSELVAGAAGRGGGTRLSVSVRPGRRLLVTVTDTAPPAGAVEAVLAAMGARQHGDATATTGGVGARWGVRPSGDGEVLWFELHLVVEVTFADAVRGVAAGPFAAGPLSVDGASRQQRVAAAEVSRARQDVEAARADVRHQASR